MDEMAETVEKFRDRARELTRLQQERVNLIASASVQRRRVTATVNADGILVDLKFSSDIDDLEYSEVAQAITEACGEAVAEVGRKSAVLLAPIRVESERAPSTDEILRGLAEIRDQL
jgi:YbaB/EbfC DNA-binding family